MISKIILDHHACIEYLAKYASKAEKMSSIISDTFKSVISKVVDSDKPRSVIKKLIIKGTGERDMGIQEVMHSILSLKLVSCTFQTVYMSLDGSRKCKIENGSLVTDKSIVDIYANRDGSKEFHVLNLISFVQNYQFVKKKITKRRKGVVVRAFPTYSSSPKSDNYGKFCKYQLVKYKPWKENPKTLWSNESDEAYITSWQQFLSTDTGKHLVLTWEDDLSKTQIYFQNETQDMEVGRHQFDWMHLAGFSTTTTSNDTCDNNVDEQAHVFLIDSSEAYNMEQTDSMPFWL